jgi:hypothetical protein
MDNSRKKSSAADRHSAPEAQAHGSSGPERRRVGRIVHDDRGNASVNWHDAPADYRRQVLEIESEEHGRGLQLQTKPRSFDPYASADAREPKKAAAPKDLRKLGEWIKMMRELEERKRKGEEG